MHHAVKRVTKHREGKEDGDSKEDRESNEEEGACQSSGDDEVSGSDGEDALPSMSIIQITAIPHNVR